jgi:hypothetical protein
MRAGYGGITAPPTLQAKISEQTVFCWASAVALGLKKLNTMTGCLVMIKNFSQLQAVSTALSNRATRALYQCIHAANAYGCVIMDVSSAVA